MKTLKSTFSALMILIAILTFSTFFEGSSNILIAGNNDNSKLSPYRIYVQDVNGNPVSGASVSASGPSCNYSQNGITGIDGWVSLPAPQDNCGICVCAHLNNLRGTTSHLFVSSAEIKVTVYSSGVSCPCSNE